MRVDSQKPNISFQEMLNNIAELNDIGSKKTVVDDGGRVELMIEYNSKLYTDYRSGINKQKFENATVKHRSIPIM